MTRHLTRTDCEDFIEFLTRSGLMPVKDDQGKRQFGIVPNWDGGWAVVNIPGIDCVSEIGTMVGFMAATNAFIEIMLAKLEAEVKFNETVIENQKKILAESTGMAY